MRGLNRVVASRCCGVQPLSSLLDVPAQLALALSLAASTVATEPPRAPSTVTMHPPVSITALVAEPLEGPYRFSEGNWLRALKEDLPQDAHGYAQSIFRTSGGRYYVPRASTSGRKFSMPATTVRSRPGRTRICPQQRASPAPRAAARTDARASSTSRISSVRRRPQASSRARARIRATPPSKQAPELAQKAQELLGVPASSLTLAQLYARPDPSPLE